MCLCGALKDAPWGRKDSTPRAREMVLQDNAYHLCCHRLDALGLAVRNLPTENEPWGRKDLTPRDKDIVLQETVPLVLPPTCRTWPGWAHSRACLNTPIPPGRRQLASLNCWLT